VIEIEITISYQSVLQKIVFSARCANFSAPGGEDPTSGQIEGPDAEFTGGIDAFTLGQFDVTGVAVDATVATTAETDTAGEADQANGSENVLPESDDAGSEPPQGIVSEGTTGHTDIKQPAEDAPDKKVAVAVMISEEAVPAPGVETVQAEPEPEPVEGELETVGSEQEAPAPVKPKRRGWWSMGR